MEIRHYVDKIMASGNQEKKDELIDMLSSIIDCWEEEDKKELENQLYEIAEGKMLNEEKAKSLIEAMRPSGMKWTLDETTNVKNQFGYDDIRPVDFWVVMNSAYNDYYDLFKDNVEYYARYAHGFIKDEDAVDDKVYYYFTMLPKN